MSRNFTEWLRRRTIREGHGGSVELQVATFLEQAIHAAAELLKADISAGKPVARFTNYLRHVWPQDATDGTRFLLPAAMPQGVGGKPVAFTVMADGHAGTTHDQGRFKGITLDIRPFLHAKTPEAVDAAAEQLKSLVHHEAEHIFNPGGRNAAGPQDDHASQQRAAVEYMSLPGEVRGHARQMARAYAREFPGEEFSPEKAKTILGRPGFTTTHANYFDKLAQPGEWERLSRSHGITASNPHDHAVAAVREMLPQYQ